MEINKVQWRMIAKGEKLPCDSFLMRKDGTMTSMVTGAGVTVGQDAYYLPVDELRSFPKEESEDERIRKELIAEVKEQIDCIPVPDCRDKEDEKALKQLNKWLAWLEKQGEQKPADKVEPKFKVGDWFVKNDGSHVNKEYNICKISKVGNVYYAIESIYGDTGKISFESFDTNFHIWTIQDAKDGDVLSNGKMIVIFKHFEEPSYRQHIVAYIGLDAIGDIQITDDTWSFGIDKIKPATKEQRDTLLKAMTDAGYTFDFEKKELKKIEQKPAWSEEDEEMLDSIIEEVRYIGDFPDYPTKEENELYDECLAKVEWLKSLKERVQPKQEWGEEDESKRKFIEDELSCLIADEQEIESPLTKRAKDLYSALYWFESLRPQKQWKPSDEQMEYLAKAITTLGYEGDNKTSAILYELRTDLKKLKG